MAEPETSPDSGQRIGAYEIRDLLGRGGMGEVFLAWDARLRRRVAIKRLRSDRGINPALRSRLLREARAVAGLSHSAVVQVYDLIEDAAGDCLVLEYVEGRTLAATLAGGALDPALAVGLAREIAEGLAAAHAAGIVHRDLKPENVIVTPSGHAKILDFGLARMRTRATDDILLTQHGVLLGTFHMMSPEQARGGEADERSDLFALGLLIHEMLTGRSPFRSDHPLETLNRVISEQPPRLDALRPDVPPRLGALVEKLLAKDPPSRPSAAAEVARELAAVASDLGSPDSAGAESVSDLPTGVLEIWREPATQAIPRPEPAPTSTAGMAVLPRRRFAQAIALAILVAALALAGYLLLDQRSRTSQGSREPAGAKRLRVLVLQPEVTGDGEGLRLAASGLLAASLSTLGALEGVTPVDPLQIVGTPKSIAGLARTAAADEVLASTLERAGDLGRVTLRRIRGTDGRVLWIDSFNAPLGALDLRLLADAVRIHLQRGFAGSRPRPGTPTLDVRNEDYAEFLAVKQRLDSGQAPADPELEHARGIIERSPRFLEARLLAADIALSLFQSRKEVAYRDLALELVQQAQRLAPEDPRPLYERFRIELAGDRPEVASATLARLEALSPGDPQLLVLRAGLAEREGRGEQAIATMRTAVEVVPSWRNLYQLSRLEARNGRNEEARRDLGKVLEISPGNLWALADLAQIELLSGDLGRAERLYQELIARSPQRPYYTNLGVVRLFLGRYEEAIAALREALALQPDHVDVTLDLADAELALGRRREAEAHYRRVLDLLAKNRPPGGLGPADSMMEAQCLARLGRTREAVAITQKALQQGLDDPEILQSAALVYALAGDRASALVNVQNALDKGVQPRWFTLPGFASLRNDPELIALLQRNPPSHARQGARAP